MNFDDMTDYVVDHTAIEQRAEAVHWLEETLTAFAKCLTPSEAQRLALELPAPASHWIRDVEHERMFGRPDELYDLVQRHLESTTGLAVERTQVAIAAMARELRAETRDWLARRMGEPWSDLLEGGSPPESKQSPERESDRASSRETTPRTLADGRPGSTTPVSESAPSAQPGSVAEENPHEDRKVSSAQDVHAEPISSGKPRSNRPVSESD